MKKQDIIDFFDERASAWDEEMIKNQCVVDKILDNAKVTAGKEILDVACGTGVLFADYLQRRVQSVLGVDISPNMVRIAAGKFSTQNIDVICADIEALQSDRLFDCAVVYNAFPHFPDPEGLIKKLSSLVKIGGTVTVAHGMSREQLDKHHSGAAHKVSNRLMSEEELAGIFEKYLTVTTKISDSSMYQVVGIKEK